MEEEILDEDYAINAEKTKKYAWMSLFLGLSTFAFLAVFYYPTFTIIDVGEDLPITWLQMIGMFGFLLCPSFGLWMSLRSKKKNEDAPKIWWSGFLLNLIGFALNLPALYFVWLGYTGETL